ncbi:hypothetical protein M422DRAFT_242098 [Sphaerobolus stellatus SS14]|nr:hypothetical protein M422DRAFT_242098 [Sphaerobolus stellatus SS14]
MLTNLAEITLEEQGFTTPVVGRLQISARNLSVRNYPLRQAPSGSDSAQDSPSTHSSTPVAGEWENLGDQVQSLEKELQEAKDNSVELSPNKDLILENKHLKQELEYYIGRAQYTLYGKDSAWEERNEYHITDISTFDGEDNDEDLTGLPTIPEDILQNIPLVPPHQPCSSSKQDFLE